MESNQISSTCIQEMANALKETPESALEQWRFQGQHGMTCFGRPAEEALAGLLEKNTKITKLGVSLQDPHWRTKVDGYITRNQDQARRLRKAKSGVSAEPVVEKIAPKDKQLGRVYLDEAPGT